MQLGICRSESFHFDQWRQKLKSSSHIVTQFMGVIFGVIHTSTLLENLLSFKFNRLINIPNTSSSLTKLTCGLP